MDSTQDLQDPWAVGTTPTGHYSELLQDATLPASFEKVFKLAQVSGEQTITIAALDKIIRSAGLPKEATDKMLYNVLSLDQTHVSREELFVILGLIALAQKNMDLPEPLLPGLESVDFRSFKGSSGSIQSGFTDPWRVSRPSHSGSSAKGPIASIGKAPGSKPISLVFDTPETPDDNVEISEAAELGGIIFRHINYNVKSEVSETLRASNKPQVRGCVVLRRYSDFYWLWEMLQKRYPYRMIPSLPPKKLGGNKAFFDERRVGLSRFINFLVVHPVLKEDSLVNTFLTESTAMVTFRRENAIHPFEEFEFSSQKTDLEHVPLSDIDSRVTKARRLVNQATHQHEKVCLALERIRARQHAASGKDYLLYSQALSSLAEQEIASEGGASDSQVFSRFDEVSNYLRKVSTLICDGAGQPYDGVIEEFRQLHLLLLSLQGLLKRTPSVEDKQVEAIRERISKASRILAEHEAQPSDTNVIEKLRQSIELDKATLQTREKRSTFIRHCLWEELDFFHRRFSQIRSIYLHLVKLELDNSAQVSRVWKQLSSVVDALPHTEGLFSS
ncbi:Sorting nexin mvp1 [Massospora cicadina]|nr:Sorting nexin mvp1 [Massospora cicadina]